MQNTKKAWCAFSGWVAGGTAYLGCPLWTTRKDNDESDGACLELEAQPNRKVVASRNLSNPLSAIKSIFS